MMSHLCNRCVREFLILARTWFAFGLPSKTGCESTQTPQLWVSQAQLRYNSLDCPVHHAEQRLLRQRSSVKATVNSAQLRT
jgi:hypothetical protein